ncbi:MAG: response regulator transcription factor [Bacteroidetes bacterium]|jgi:two-component system LytT family response regulator|nr:response regulator transcription factor [Bacteroidota bacterium]MCA6442480.1 response regulator transcription factor [Bacteroidota bacterium]
MENIKVIVIDDEQHARTVLGALLEKSFPEVTIVGEGDSLPKAIELIHSKNPDIVFLDIEMPNYSGLQINDFIKEGREFDIVFITAYDQYAINAIKMAAFDYLLKPIDANELKETISRFKQKKEKNLSNSVHQRLTALNENLTASQPKKLIIQTHQGVHYFEMENILYIEASGMYTIVHSKTGQFVASKPIKEFESLLNEYFFRAHRSYVVNCNYVVKYSNKDGGLVTLVDGTSIPISRTKKNDLLVFLRKIQNV